MLRLSLEKKSCARTKGKVLNTPDSIAAFITEQYGCSPQERFLSVLMGPGNEIIGVQEVSFGGLTATQVDPRVLFSGAITAGASAIILVHNHPSGSAEPSQDDVRLTQQLIQGSKLLGIRVLDHLIIARGGSYVSMVAKGIVSFGDDASGA